MPFQNASICLNQQASLAGDYLFYWILTPTTRIQEIPEFEDINIPPYFPQTNILLPKTMWILVDT